MGQSKILPPFLGATEGMFGSIPPVPVTNDPERLRSYISFLLPLYHKKELEVSHTNLQKKSLFNRLSELEDHLTKKSWDIQLACDENEFYKNFAEVTLKERDDLIHSNRNHITKHNHFTWHSCCHQNSNRETWGKNSLSEIFTQTPLISVLRGEKLEKSYADNKCLSSQLHTKEQLLSELKQQLNTEKENYEIQIAVHRDEEKQLNLQLSQQMIFYSSLERKCLHQEESLKEMETTNKKMTGEIEVEKEKINQLEINLKKLNNELEKEQNLVKKLQDALSVSQNLEKQLNFKCSTLETELLGCQAEKESLRGEIELLRRQDIAEVIDKYSAKITDIQKISQERDRNKDMLIDQLQKQIHSKSISNINATNCPNTTNEGLDKEYLEKNNSFDIDSDIECSISKISILPESTEMFEEETPNTYKHNNEIDPIHSNREETKRLEENKKLSPAIDTKLFSPFDLLNQALRRRCEEQKLAELDQEELKIAQAIGTGFT